MKKTPFYNNTLAKAQTPWWFHWGEYIVPEVYDNPIEELKALRTSVAINDMSPEPTMQISGPDAHQFVNYLCTRNTLKMEVGYAWYTPWCDDDGNVVGDGMVCRFEEDLYIITAQDSIEFFKSKSAGFDVEIIDVDDEWGIISLMGPKSSLVMKAVTGRDWLDTRTARIYTTQIDGREIYLIRHAFVGNNGYELFVKWDDGESVWDAIVKAGEEYGIRHSGQYANHITRIEAGIILASADYTPAGPDKPTNNVVVSPEHYMTPYELGLGHCVNLNQEADFVGKQALIEEHKKGPARSIVGLELDVQSIIDVTLQNNSPLNISMNVRWDKLDVNCDGERIGYASSITWSPTIGKMIGFGIISSECIEIGKQLSIDWADFWGNPLGEVSATIVELPFYKPAA